MSHRERDRAGREPSVPGCRRTSLAFSSLALVACLAVCAPAPGRAAQGSTRASTLVLYDETGPFGSLGELYAIAAGNLASRFGDWTAKPVRLYRHADLAGAAAVIYIGSTYDEPLPAAFLKDVLAGARPTIWIFENIHQLVDRAPSFRARYGFTPSGRDTTAVAQVRYKGRTLTRDTRNDNPIMTYRGVAPDRAQVIATAVRPDGSTFPWGVRARNLTYVGENPFVYISETDRYLAFCDLLFDVLAPKTPERHRAVLRLEDVTPRHDPAVLRRFADTLSAEGVPFGIAVVPVYVDPLGAQSRDRRPSRLRLRDAPKVVAALRYMIEKGGTLVLHGYTHQYGAVKNPYSGVTVADFEFYRAHVTGDDRVELDGPVPDDSDAFAERRVSAALEEFAAAGLPRPTIFEFPHYAGSAVDARTLARTFDVAWHRGLYFKGALTGAAGDPRQTIGQFFPFPVRDVYGWRIVPENIGNYQPRPINASPTRTADDLVANAKTALVVRDGVAGLFYHPTFGLESLERTVAGLKGAGYVFVAPEALEDPGGARIPATRAAARPSP